MKYPKRGGDCEYTMECMWGADGRCDITALGKCIREMEVQNEK